MKSKGEFLLFLGLFFAVIIHSGDAYSKNGYAIKGFIGKSSTEAAPNTEVHLLDGKTGARINTVSTNFFGKYSFSGLNPGVYILKIGTIQKKVNVQEKDVRVDIDMNAEGGTMDYAKPFIQKQQKPIPSESAKSKVPQTDIPNNASLAAQIAGTWWGYSNSTERKIGLCADGSYMDYTESGYSGRSFDSGGNQTMAWGTANQGDGAGTWQIQGNDQQGTIYVTYNNGRQATFNYRQCGESGCLLFNGNKLCRTAKSCE